VSAKTAFIDINTVIPDSLVTLVTVTVVSISLVNTGLSTGTAVELGRTAFIYQNDLTGSPITTISLVTATTVTTWCIGTNTIAITIVLTIGTLVNIGTVVTIAFVSTFTLTGKSALGVRAFCVSVTVVSVNLVGTFINFITDNTVSTITRLA
jgi:hypothetical protein